MFGTLQDVAIRLYALPEWLEVESLTVHCGEESLRYTEPVTENFALPAHDTPFSILIEVRPVT